MSYTRAWLAAKEAIAAGDVFDTLVSLFERSYEADDLEGETSGLEQRAEAAESEVENAAEEAKGERDRASWLEAKCDELRIECDSLKTKIEALETRSSATLVAVATVEERDRLRDEIRRLQAFNCEDRVQISELRDEIEGLRKQLRAKPPTDLQAHRKLAAIRKLLDDVSPGGTEEAKPLIEGVKKAARLARRKKTA